MNRIAFVVTGVWLLAGALLFGTGFCVARGYISRPGLPYALLPADTGGSPARTFEVLGLSTRTHTYTVPAALGPVLFPAWVLGLLAMSFKLLWSGRTRPAGRDRLDSPRSTPSFAPSNPGPDRVVAVRSKMTGKMQVPSLPGGQAMTPSSGSSSPEHDAPTLLPVDPPSSGNPLFMPVQLIEKGKYSEAIPVLQELLRNGHARADSVRAYLAACFLENGDIQVAKGYLEELAQVKPEIGVAYLLARACERAGLDSRAEQLYQSVYARDVGYRDVADRLAKLGQSTSADGSLSALRKLLPARYSQVELLGRGGMGVVFKAFDVDLHRPVAIKMMSPDLSGETIQQRFLIEARALARLRHRALVEIFDIRLDRVPWFVMEFVEGSTLARLASTRSLQPVRLLRYMEQMLDGLAYCHSKRMYHRDVKPENILISEDDEVKLLDFGLVRMSDAEGLTRPGAFLGTPIYAAPEQARGEEVDQRADIYSFGATFHFLFTGQHRAAAGSAPVAGAEVPASAGRVLPVALARILDRCMAASLDTRYQACEEVQDALRRTPAAELLPAEPVAGTSSADQLTG